MLPIKDGKYIKLTFKDQGEGIPKENLEKIFDPYYTTKEKGNGLGLAICYSIIKNHDGHIRAESEIGKGSSFMVYLPATDRKVKKKKEEKAIPAGLKGRILLMDDEEIIRETASEALKEIGYQTDLALNGEEAVKLYQKASENDKPYDLVIMDLTIPGGMGGKETIKILTEYDPDVKAVVSSGYSNDPIMANFKAYGFCGVITKPYSVDEMAQTIHKIISP